MITNMDATLFSRVYNPSTRLDEWRRIYIEKVWWFKNEKSLVTTDGLKSEDVYTVRIPDRSVRIEKGDYLVKGNCSVKMESVKDLEGLERLKVMSVNDNTFGDNPHIKVVGV